MTGNTRPTGLIEQVVTELRARIADGTWPVGSRIPTEPELVEFTGVGRNTVREAVQSLVHAGLLERRQGSGTYVLANKEMAVAMSRSIADSSQRDVLEVRLALEVAAASFAARRRTPAEITTLREIQRERAAALAAGKLDVMVDRDLRLHRTIAVASHNEVLAELYDNLLEALAANIRFNFNHPAHVDDNHDGIIDAIEAGNPVTASREVSRYLESMIAASAG